MTVAKAPLIKAFSILWKLALLVAFVLLSSYVSGWITQHLQPALTPGSEPQQRRVIMLAMIAYTALMALPFIPGVEIGLGLLMAFGASIAPLVYFGTILALSAAFLIGRLVPEAIIVRTFDSLRLRRAASLMRRVAPMDKDARIRFLLQAAPGRMLPILLKYRFLILILALNIPGNALIGGGGGICMVAGFCRLFTFPKFLVAVACAVAPVPLLVYLAG